MLPEVPLVTRQSSSLEVMAFLRASIVVICAATATVLAAPTIYATPIVTLDKGEFIGTTADGVNNFLGIPFAKPPSVVAVGLTLCPFD